MSLRCLSLLSVAIPVSIFSLGTAACDSGSGSTSDAATARRPGDPAPEVPGPHHQFVVKKVRLPGNVPEANQLGLDLDGNGTVDNKLGAAIGQVQGFQIDLQGVIDRLIARGDLLLLNDLRAETLQQANQAVFWLLRGANPNPAPCKEAGRQETCGQHLLGNASFEFDQHETRTSFLVGSVAGGRFKGGPDTVRIALPLAEGQPAVPLDLLAARGDIATSLENGKVGGALSKSDVDTVLIPAVHGVVRQVVTTNCQGTAPTCCTPGSAGAVVVQVLDGNHDCQVSIDEFKGNALVSNLFELDLDLFDKQGNYKPNTDGVKDSLSFGFSFTATKATFPAPQ